MTLDHQSIPYILYNLVKKAGTLVFLYLRMPSSYVGTYRQKLNSLRTFAFNKKLFFLTALNKWRVTELRSFQQQNNSKHIFLAKPVGHIIYRTDAPWFSPAKTSRYSTFIFITSKLTSISLICLGFLFLQKALNREIRHYAFMFPSSHLFSLDIFEKKLMVLKCHFSWK